MSTYPIDDGDGAAGDCPLPGCGPLGEFELVEAMASVPKVAVS